MTPAGAPADEPVFAEPWQAQAFALTVALADAGYFTWDEWSRTLGDEIAAARAVGDPDLGTTYYEHWRRALERICAVKGLVGAAALAARTDAWRRAHLATPHGQPVELARGEAGAGF